MIGIENVNEFFATHYLAAIIGAEIQPELEAWRVAAREREVATPWRRLARLQRDLFGFRARLADLRSPSARTEAHLDITTKLLAALGYTPAPCTRELSRGYLALLGARVRADGEPLLWLVPVVSSHACEGDLLGRSPTPTPRVGPPPPGNAPSVEALVSEAFGLPSPPRFILILGDTEWVLAERGKWAEQRLLRFDWVELLGRREPPTLELVTALLHRERLAPEFGPPLLDRLDDSSHKHAFAVSRGLEAALRDSIERIGNEVIRSHHEASPGVPADLALDGQALAIQCIRFMYRILFLLYVEARPELGYAPMDSEAYRLGYSFERLRELELVELTSPEAREGHTIHACLDRLFTMVHAGTAALHQQTHTAPSSAAEASAHHPFTMVPLRSRLFDPARTPALNFGVVKLRNEVLIEVIRALSLSAPQGSGKAKRRGRISYASLGIHQLGAVYESLLSLRGSISGRPLNPSADPAELGAEAEPAAIVSAQRDPAGSFRYRRAGRDRQRSASYYTPEALTQCLVGAALDELLDHEDGSPKLARAEDLLELTICEPAMGSAAFLNEAINQLAERYLQRRQRELGERIPHQHYRQALQKVRMYIADNNVYGVDLNPLALELAELSLWLNAIFAETTEHGAEVFVPWFGAQLACGNSLVGAWRRVFTHEQLDAGPSGTDRAWLEVAPQPLAHGAARPPGSVYHFLLPAPGMATPEGSNRDAPLLAPHAREFGLLEAWRSEVCRPLADAEIDELARLSDAIDALWAEHSERALALRRQTSEPLSVYGHRHPLADQGGPRTSAAKQRFESRARAGGPGQVTSPYPRLKRILDYWCALWFWPIQAAACLPKREDWHRDIAELLDLEAPVHVRAPRLAQVEALAHRYRFHHWELECAAFLAARGGFDLVIGNPPWIKLEWKRAEVLAQWLAPAELASAKGLGPKLDELLADPKRRDEFVRELEGVSGLTALLSSTAIYPELHGLTVNYYRNFISLGTQLIHERGCAAFIHPENLFESNRFAALRTQLYPRLRTHFQFQNALALFPIAHRKRYGLSVFGRPRAVSFTAVFNLFHPSTLDAAALPAEQPTPAIKTADDRWDLRGHPHRRIHVDARELELFARLFGSPDAAPCSAPLPRLHASELRPLLVRAAASERRTGDLDGLFSDSGWNERDAPRRGILRKLDEAPFAERPLGLVIKGPHFHVANPLAKTPRRVCTNKSHYEVLDLLSLPPDYLPRTAFGQALPDEVYRRRARTILGGAGQAGPRTSLDTWRLVVSRQLSLDGERTLQPALIPPGVAHIHSVFGLGVDDPGTLVSVAALWSSLPLDFLVKLSGAQDMSASLARMLPFADARPSFARVRALRLNALTRHYAPLWTELFEPAWCDEGWLIEDRRTADRGYAQLGPEWTPQTPLRTAYARRRALIELDVWATAALGLGLNDLLALYRVQFPVLRSYEANTWYDAAGRIVHTTNKSLPGVGLPSRARDPSSPGWDEVAHMSEEAGYTGSDLVTQTIQDDTLPGGPRTKTIHYRAPWIRCQREHDYASAWQAFTAR